jgi:ribosomal protein S12 methylthiotransferase accessory factor
MSIDPRKGLRGNTRKGFFAGSHRLISPAQTVAKIAPLLPVFGITRVANITGLDTVGIPVVIVCRPNSRSLSVSQGKGSDLLSAKASGVMEAVEAHHAEHITLPLKFSTLNELQTTHELVDVDQLPTVAVNQFHPDLRILWIEGFDLLQNVAVWLPHETVHLDYTIPLPPGSGCFASSSTGLASGNHVLEAISHGICEVIERDAIALWSASIDYLSGERRIELSTIVDPIGRQLLQRFIAADVFVAVWEVTSNISVPCFYCTVLDNDSTSWRASYPCAGSGCHATREVALIRALTEAAQTRLTLIAGSRDDTPNRHYVRIGNVEKLDRLRVRLFEALPNRSFHEVPTYYAESFVEEVEWLLEHLRSANCRSVIAVDLTKPELGINVVRVVIPGLESSHEVLGYVPGPRARTAALIRQRDLS